MMDIMDSNPNDPTNEEGTAGDKLSLAAAIAALLVIFAGMLWVVWNLAVVPVIGPDFPNLHLLPSQSSERMAIQDWLTKSDKAEFVSYVSTDTNAVPTLVVVKDKSTGITHKCDIMTYSHQDGSIPTAALFCDGTDTATYTIPLSSIPH